MNDSRVEIHLAVLRANVRAVRAALAPGVDFIAMLKADAYGHGLDIVGRAAWECGVRRFAVFHTGEAIRLRHILPDSQLLLAGVADPGDTALLLELGIQPFLITVDQGLGFAREAARLGAVLTVHAKIDTGMGRLGFPWENAADDLVRLAAQPGLRLDGACTHFASAGSADRAFADIQAGRFRRVLRECRDRGLVLPFCHAANSDALCRTPDWHFQAVRPGILLYGYGKSGPDAPVTRPFLQWKSRLVQVKSVPAGFPVSYDSTYHTPRATRLGTIPVGYSDGYSRAWSNRAFVLVRGRRAPVAGRVTMNLLMVDLGADSGAQTGDEAVLLGEQDGVSIWADELARLAGTISYEVLTSIRGSRIPVEAHGQS